jgi:DNA-binding SARP family transcriptional activator
MASPSSSIRIFLLGRFEVVRGERLLPAAAWTRRKAAALLQRLALERRLLKDQAIDFLWPEADLTSGSNNLYRTIHALRQTVDTALGPGTASELFTFEDGVLSLAGSVWVDVQEFERLCSEALAETPEQRAVLLEQALALYTGELLPDERYAEWTIGPREALHRRQREARLAFAAHARDARDYAKAISLLSPLLAHDPADEPVHRESMLTYALAGRRHEALRQYQACVDALAAELDVPPEPATAALYARILNGELTPPPAPFLPAWVPPAPVALEMEHVAPLVGRHTELETLRMWLHCAWRGHGRTLFLAGDSGVGKTRLAFEVLREAADAGMITLLGAAYEQEGQLPYQPFIEAFDRYLAEHRRSPDENPITHFKRLGSSDPQQEHVALFNATATFLTSLAARTPVVLLIDDLHAADETSLRLFHYLTRRTQIAPVILLATYRVEVVTTASPFGALLNALYREHLSETLSLAPLAEYAVASIMAHSLGGEVTPALVKAVFDITEGNPFFVQEIIHAWLKSGQVEEHEGQWSLRGSDPGGRPELHLPAGLSGLLRERVRRLGPSVESALAAAAVIGREFSFDVLRGVVSLSDGELLDALDAALDGHLLEETEDGYRFRHLLIRRALYDSLSRVRRARLHGQTAKTIEVVYARRPHGLDPHVEELAFHYDLSDRRDRALDYLIQAGRKAGRMYAFEVAINYYERALALLDALPAETAPEQRFRLLESLGKYYKVLADTPKAVAAFERALGVVGKGWNARPCDRARIHRLAAMGLLTAGQLDEAASHLQAALAELSGGNEDTLEFANVLYNVAQLHWHRDEYREAFEVAQRSLAVAEQLNDPAAIARAFEMLALACHSLGEWQTGISYEQRRAALVGPGLDVSDAFDVHL